MNSLFFDTETTGKADFNANPTADHQPRLVQLAALLVSETGIELASVNLIIRPVDFEIPKEASDIHGITTETAKECGVPLLHALSVFSGFCKVAGLYVAHNIQFDHLIMSGECSRMIVELPMRTTFCTMKEMTPICKIKGPYGPKWPKLQEAHRHAFGREFEGAHDAMADVRACKDVYFWMKNRVAEVVP